MVKFHHTLHKLPLVYNNIELTRNIPYLTFTYTRTLAIIAIHCQNFRISVQGQVSWVQPQPSLPRHEEAHHQQVQAQQD
jgi:hypothetical protein